MQSPGGVAQRVAGGRTPGVGRSSSVCESPAVVAGLDDVAVVGDAVEHGGEHLNLASLRQQGDGLLIQRPKKRLYRASERPVVRRGKTEQRHRRAEFQIVWRSKDLAGRAIRVTNDDISEFGKTATEQGMRQIGPRFSQGYDPI